MNDFINGFLEGLYATSILESISTVAALIYVILAAKRLMICWYFAFGSSAIGVYIFYESQLYVESALNIFYVIMAIVGFVMWNNTKSQKAQIQEWSLKSHALIIGVSLLTSVVLGYLLDQYTNQAAPYIDSFTTIFALSTTYMVSKKVLSNWVYWIIIDGVSVYLYLSRGLELFAVLFILYVIIAIFGWFEWRKKYRLQLS